jgi:hypothetical protein
MKVMTAINTGIQRLHGHNNVFDYKKEVEDEKD